MKVRFEYQGDGEHRTETLWATTDNHKVYALCNVPFFAYDVSYGDVVFASPSEDEGIFEFSGVAQRGGHSTYRLFLTVEVDSDRFRDHWTRLAALGCTYERATQHLLAVDVPPTADVNQVYELLDAGEQWGVWDFEEGHCGHPVRDPKTEK